MTKREEAEQAMRFGVSDALGAMRVALLREAINEALEEAAQRVVEEWGKHGCDPYEECDCARTPDSAKSIADDIRALKKES